MKKEPAISLLLKSALLDPSHKNLRIIAGDIVKELCFLPLAIDQAGAAIAGGLCPIEEYLSIYYQHHQVLLEGAVFKGASNYGHSVYGTWDVTFTEMVARAAGEHDPLVAQAASMAIFLLQIFSFFHCEGITEEIFRQAAEAPRQATDNDLITLDNA
jgi:hypothetical protein